MVIIPGVLTILYGFFNFIDRRTEKATKDLKEQTVSGYKRLEIQIEKLNTRVESLENGQIQARKILLTALLSVDLADCKEKVSEGMAQLH